MKELRISTVELSPMKPLVRVVLSSCLLLVPALIAAMGFHPDHHSGLRVSLPSLNSTTSFWLDLPPEESPFANVGSTGSLTQDADICVIGSGITGVGVVWHLVKDLQDSLEDGANMKIVLLEARQFCKVILQSKGGQRSQPVYSGSGATGNLSSVLQTYRYIITQITNHQDETVVI